MNPDGKQFPISLLAFAILIILIFISCWSLVTQALSAGDMETATQEKFNIETRQRQEGELREQSKKTWTPKYFDLNHDIYTLKCYSR
jgi:Oxysterol-binding protein